MTERGMISADSHVIEPRSLWVERVNKQFHDRAPRVVRNPNGRKGEWFICEGLEPRPASLAFAAGKDPSEYSEFQKATNYDDGIPGGWEAAPRLKDMALDGVEAEVIYTTLGFRLFGLLDEPFQRELFRVYNDWLAELCSYDSKHLLGLALIPLLDVEAGVKELRRCARMGLRGALIMCSPPEGQSYADRTFDPFWAEAQALNMPLSLHLGTGHGRESRYDADLFLRAMTIPHEVQRTFATLLFGGVLERFPDLKFVSAENDIGWVPHFLARADLTFHKLGSLKLSASGGARLKMLPSEYFRRQVYATFIDDAVGVRNSNLFGADNYM
ncbi:MAG: amidohydrolase family protein, partial [Nitrospinae bacterium]|nr:amidohydrolase family protein [Nitrospinota bacterium]